MMTAKMLTNLTKMTLKRVKSEMKKEGKSLKKSTQWDGWGILSEAGQGSFFLDDFLLSMKSETKERKGPSVRWFLIKEFCRLLAQILQSLFFYLFFSLLEIILKNKIRNREWNQKGTCLSRLMPQTLYKQRSPEDIWLASSPSPFPGILP